MAVRTERLEAERILLIALLCDRLRREVAERPAPIQRLEELRADMPQFAMRVMGELAPFLTAMGIDPHVDLREVLLNRLHAAADAQERIPR
ncbi:MAG: hypothetical protein Q7S23_02105 [bacterium]|nr:hypothetical protein [bacterium]